ncbi:MAG: iron ABC transporter permease [Bifidobacteriaceae bacterium]|jgi:thiamine transport system permease protein|nr:iron ABC transporter permease [Bifidobacteriaceae bacterium]
MEHEGRWPEPDLGRALRVAAVVAAVIVPLAFFGVVFAWPVAAMIGRGFTDAGHIDITGFSDVFARPRTWRIIGQTLGQAGAATVIVGGLGLPAAHICYRRRFPGRGVVRLVFTVPFVLPAVVVGVAFRSLIGPSGPLGWLGIDGTMTAVIAALVFFNCGLFVRSVGTFWAGIDPRPGQAARALGASGARTWWTVTMPSLAPAIASTSCLVFLFSATAFGTVLILGGLRAGTIETEIWLQTTQMLDLRAASVLSVVQLAVVVLVLGAAGAARRRRERSARVRAPSGREMRRLVRADIVPGVVTALTALAITGPMAALAVRSLHTGSGWGFGNYARLAVAGGTSGMPTSMLAAAGTSIRVAAGATVISLVIGLMVAGVASRRARTAAGRRLVGMLDGIAMAPLGVSAVTVGFGFLIALDRPPLDLRGSALMVPLAQAVVATPVVVRSMLPVLRGIDPRQREAAALLGASPARVWCTIDLPIAARALGVAAGLAFAVAMGEFGATAFLARPATATLPVAIFRLLGRPGPANFGTALAGCVLLAAVTSAVMVLAERARVRGWTGRERGGAVVEW